MTRTRQRSRGFVRRSKWDGATWSALGSGLYGYYALAEALAVYDGKLIAGGSFSSAGGQPANCIAAWDGASWSALGMGIGDPSSSVVSALLTFDDGSGPALYAAGEFHQAGGVPVNNIARWNGSDWSAVGEGFNGAVHALAVFDDGTGPTLYAAGRFTGRIAKWNGQSWTVVAGPLSATVYMHWPVFLPLLGRRCSRAADYGRLGPPRVPALRYGHASRPSRGAT